MQAWSLVRAVGVALLFGCGGRAIDGGDAVEPAPIDEPPLPDGAGGAGGELGATPTLLDDALSAMLDDLSQRPAADQRFTRYLLLTPYEDPRRDPSEGSAAQATLRVLEDELRGVSKLANSLSREETITPPAATASPGLLRIDLRAYGWEQTTSVAGARHADGWEAIAAHAVLGVEFEGPDADRLKRSSESLIPFLFARDFIAAASMGELYYELLGVPRTLDELRQVLTEEVLQTAPTVAPPVFRGAFARSGVSLSPRIVQRTGGSEHAYWQAFDFREQARALAALVDTPISSADATELIFTLPNGLFAYFTADEQGQRVSESPLRGLVIDPAQPDQVMRNAASCFACHNAGVIPFSDEVRDSVLATPPFMEDRPRGALLILYPERAVMEDMRRIDNEAYQDALRGAVLDDGYPDTVSGISLDFRFLPLTRAAAAAELFLTPAALAGSLEQMPAGFAALDTPAGMPREDFTASYLGALCALNQGSRNRPVGCR